MYNNITTTTKETKTNFYLSTKEKILTSSLCFVSHKSKDKTSTRSRNTLHKAQRMNTTFPGMQWGDISLADWPYLGACRRSRSIQTISNSWVVRQCLRDNHDTEKNFLESDVNSRPSLIYRTKALVSQPEVS